jgi:hypothetical protein
MWNDSRIQALNSPEVAALLPGTPIKIVVEGYSSGYQTTFTYWLNATVSGWQVRVPPNGCYCYCSLSLWALTWLRASGGRGGGCNVPHSIDVPRQGICGAG